MRRKRSRGNGEWEGKTEKEDEEVRRLGRRKFRRRVEERKKPVR